MSLFENEYECMFCQEVYESERELFIHCHIHSRDDEPIPIFTLRKIQLNDNSFDDQEVKVPQKKNGIRDYTIPKSKTPPISCQLFPTPPTSPELFEDTSVLEKGAKLYNDLLWEELQYQEIQTSELEKAEELENEGIMRSNTSSAYNRNRLENKSASSEPDKTKIYLSIKSCERNKSFTSSSVSPQDFQEPTKRSDEEHLFESTNYEETVHNKGIERLKSTDRKTFCKTSEKGIHSREMHRLYKNRTSAPKQTTPKSRDLSGHGNVIVPDQKRLDTGYSNCHTPFESPQNLNYSKNKNLSESNKYKRSIGENDTISSSKRRCLDGNKPLNSKMEVFSKNSPKVKTFSENSIGVKDLTPIRAIQTISDGGETDLNKNADASVKTLVGDLSLAESHNLDCNESICFTEISKTRDNSDMSSIKKHNKSNETNHCNNILDRNRTSDSVGWDETLQATANLMLTLTN